MTPETDAKASDIIGFFSCATVPAEFARKLERERDEARARVEIITPNENNPVAKFFSSSNTPETDAAVKDSNGQWSFVLKETCQRLERERDEAREKWKDQNEALRTLAEHGESEIQRLTKERDEAREALRKCVWWAECVSRRVTEDRESINWTGLQLARKALADIQMEAAK